jgi:DNA polymerase elongation subunit (family B)
MKPAVKPDYFEGWLTGVRIEDGSAVLTLKQESGENVDFRDGYSPYFYIVCGDAGSLGEVRHIIGQHPGVTAVVTERRFPSVESSRRRAVLRVVVEGAKSFGRVVADCRKIPFALETAETTVPHHSRYMMDRGLWFFRKYRVEEGAQGIVSIRPVRTERLPDLTLAAVSVEGRGCIRLLTGKGRTYECGLDELPGMIRRRNIDVLFSYGGDRSLAGLREAVRSDYGLMLPGCIHIDVKRDIPIDIYAEDHGIGYGSGMLGNLLDVGRRRMLRIMELCRMTGARPELLSRVSPGMLNTYLHKRAARKKGYVIPDSKRLIERPKSLRLLSIMDKGGLIFYPEPGIYPDVAKFDFASMYPNIIVRFNISPETLNCGCCDGRKRGNPVPEAGWHTCGMRKGIIPQGIRPVLRARQGLKRMMKFERDPGRRKSLDIRQRALKNILVTSFGYLGFRNFVFSNVECKESVMLYGRQILLRAKGIAESLGLDVVYGITDSVFVRNGDPESYRRFSEAVTRETGIELEHDRTFKAIAFPCSDDGSGAANKNYGVTHEGELECRGIYLRHGDAPPLLKDFQEHASRALLAGDRPLERLDENFGNAVKMLECYKRLVVNRHLPLHAYAITMALRRPLDSYVSNAPHVAAGRLMPDMKPDGRRHRHVTYVYSVNGPVPMDHADPDSIDVRKYVQLLDRSLQELARGIWTETPMEAPRDAACSHIWRWLSAADDRDEGARLCSG